MDRRAEARRLRERDGLSVAQIGARLTVPPSTVRDWGADLPVPAWTRRPRAKDELRARAAQLRSGGWSVPDIARELGVSRSTVWSWVGGRPLDRDGDRATAAVERRRAGLTASWARRRAEAAGRRQEVEQAAAASVGRLGRAEIMRLGALIYWCEGTKLKAYRPNTVSFAFVNSDPGLIRLFLRFLDAAGVPAADRSFRVSIHESADAAAAVEWWANVVGVPATRFRRSAVKRHNPTTNRRNTGAEYHGCLVVHVCRSHDLYWTVRGIVRGVIEQACGADVTACPPRSAGRIVSMC